MLAGPMERRVRIGTPHLRTICIILAMAVSVVCAAAELLLPLPSGDVMYRKGGTDIDASHADCGYIMVRQKASSKKLKLRVSHDGTTLTYDLNSNGEYEVFPLQLGSGKYTVQVFSRISGNKYSTLSSQSFEAQVADETLPFRYPNQYVDYDADTLAIGCANDLCSGLDTDRQKLDAISSYVTSTLVYDYLGALTVESGYLPDLDAVMKKGQGICFDFASLTACMLRSQGIAAKLVIGYADSTYHAWNEALIDGEWVHIDNTAVVCGQRIFTYTVERVY